MLKPLALTNRFSACWPQSHLLCLYRQVTSTHAHMVQQSRSPASKLLRPPTMMLRPTSQMLRPLAVPNRFSACWPQSHLLCLYRQVTSTHAHRVQPSHSPLGGCGHSPPSQLLRLSSLVLGPLQLNTPSLLSMPLQLSNVTATKALSIESLNFNVAEPCAIEVSITAANSAMIELQPTGSGGAISRADSSGKWLYVSS